jgi:hypothetical protein
MMCLVSVVLAAAALALVPAARAQVQPPPDAVATVGDTVISKATFDRWLGDQGATRPEACPS